MSGVSRKKQAQPVDMAAYVNNPYPFHRDWREQGEMQFIGLGAGFEAVVSHPLVLSLLRDPRFSAKRANSLLPLAATSGEQRPSYAVLAEMLGKWLLFMDPPDHTRLRKLMTKEFSPAAVERMEPKVDRLVEKMFDSVGNRSEIDFMEVLARPFPTWIIAELLGVPPEMNAQLLQWSDALAMILGNHHRTFEQCDAAQDAAVQLTAYFRQLVRERRGKSGSDLISLLLEIEADGEFLTENELLAQCVMLLFGGNDTTRSLLGNSLYTLLRHRRQLETLSEDPTLIRNAVEELLRFESPVQIIGRVALEDLQIGQTEIAKGQTVLLMLGAANRDPALFDNPDELDLTRGNNPHLAFGGGAHFCLGNQIARMEAQSFILKFFRRFPNVRFAGQSLEWLSNITFRGLKSLPILLR